MAKYKVTLDTGESYEIDVEGPHSKEGEWKARAAAQQESLLKTKTGPPPTGELTGTKPTPPIDYFGLRDSFAQGLTFNLADEAAAGLGAAGDLLQGKTNIRENYGNRVAQHRADLKKFEEDHPTAAFISSLTGSLPTAVIPGVGARRAAQAAAAGRALPWTQRAWNAARTGAISGGISGYGGSEGGPGASAKGTALGAAVGMAISGGLPTLGEGARKLGITGAGENATQRVADALSGTRFGQEVMERLPGVVGPDEERAAQQILEYIRRNGLSMDEVAEEVRKLGRHATIADVAMQTRKLAARHMKTPGDEQAPVARFLQERALGAKDRVVEAVNRATGRNQTKTAVEDTLAAAKDAASPGYNALFAAHPEPVRSPRIQQLFDRKLFQDALEEVRGYHSSSDNPLPEDYIDLRTIDEVKKYFNGAVRQGRRSANGIHPGKQHAMEEAERNLVEEADSLFPAYPGVRERYATPAQLEDALEAGRKYADMEPERITQTLRSMSPAEREHFKQGVAEVVRAKVLDPKKNINVYTEVVGSRTEQGRLRRVFSSKKIFEDFMADMYPEESFAFTKGAIEKGSNTFENILQHGDNPMDDTVLKAGEKLFEGKPIAALGQVAKDAINSRGSALADPALRLLTGPPTYALPVLRKAEYKYRQGLLTPPPNPRVAPSVPLGNVGTSLLNRLGR